jgi:alkaline phosphatase D
MQFFGRGRAFVAALALAAALSAGAQKPKLSAALPLQHVDNGNNSEAAQQAHYVVLVSLDGFRWDYAKRYGAKHLLDMGEHGVWAPNGMLPSFPSLTFPNHFTVVTGLYPEHHGLVANTFYDETKKQRYMISDDKVVSDGTWYSGVPLWSLAESQGMRTACLLWPGSEAEIAGHRPTWYAHFDNKSEREDASKQARIDDVAALLKLPAAERPHFITIYFSDTDHAGHDFGPDSPETKAAVLKVDELVEKLRKALEHTKLPVDLVVVSDHGMVKVEGPWVTLDKFADLSGIETAGGSLYPKSEDEAAKLYNELKKASSQFVVYRRKNVPANLHYDQNPREGDPVVMATGPYAIRMKTPAADKPDKEPTAGAHGYDPHTMPEMKASFFAEGPDIVRGKTVQPFENVNLYPWMAHILGLTPPKSDGELSILSGTLRDNGGTEPVSSGAEQK